MKGEHYHEYKYNEVKETTYTNGLTKYTVIRFCTQCLETEEIDYSLTKTQRTNNNKKCCDKCKEMVTVTQTVSNSPNVRQYKVAQCSNLWCEDCHFTPTQSVEEKLGLDKEDMENYNLVNSHTQDWKEEEIKLFNVWYNNQKEMYPTMILNYFLTRISSLEQRVREEIDNKLISSMPSDAENLSTLTPDQALKTIRNFINKLQSNGEEK